MEDVGDRFDDDEVADFVRGHDQEIETLKPKWAMYSRAFRSEFWSKEGNAWTGIVPGIGDGKNDPFPIKVEVNQVWPFVQAHVSNLFYRAPRVELEYPAVVEPKSGRPLDDTTAARRMRAFDDEWIRRSDCQAITTYVLQLAVTHGFAGYKLGTRESKSVMGRVWIDAIKRWELLYDDRAPSAEQMTYIGHIRYERIDRARKITDDPLTDADLEMLPDVLESDTEGTSHADRKHAKKYVRVLEFYDLLANEQRFYLVSGNRSGASVKQVGKVLPIPWELENGRPGVPIVPVILSNDPEYPMQGVSAVARIYTLNAETNLLLTIVANGLRRDAARIAALSADAPDALIEAIRDAVDGTVVKVPPGVNLERLLQNIEWAPFSSTLEQYKSWLAEARQDSQGMSDLMQGRQGKYISATEADILAGTGETSAIEIGARLGEATARAIELMHVMIADTVEKVSIRTTEGREEITADEMRLPWTVSIVDSGTTPTRDRARKQEFAQVQPVLLELTKIASAPDTDPMAAADPAAALAAPQQASPQTKLAAQLQIDHMVTLYQLPETMSWRSLSQATAPKAKSKISPERLAQAEALIERVLPEPEPPIAPVNGGV